MLLIPRTAVSATTTLVLVVLGGLNTLVVELKENTIAIPVEATTRRQDVDDGGDNRDDTAKLSFEEMFEEKSSGWWLQMFKDNSTWSLLLSTWTRSPRRLPLR